MNNLLSEKDRQVIGQAISIIEKTALKTDLIATSATTVKNYCRLQLASSDRELFAVLFLNTANQLISFDVLFKGGVSSSEVHPNVVAKQALLLSSSAVIIAHNHPSNTLRPSDADIAITKKLTKVLELVDVKMLDHIIVTRTGEYSFAENGLV